MASRRSEIVSFTHHTSDDSGLCKKTSVGMRSSSHSRGVGAMSRSTSTSLSYSLFVLRDTCASTLSSVTHRVTHADGCGSLSCSSAASSSLSALACLYLAYILSASSARRRARVGALVLPQSNGPRGRGSSPRPSCRGASRGEAAKTREYARAPPYCSAEPLLHLCCTSGILVRCDQLRTVGCPRPRVRVTGAGDKRHMAHTKKRNGNSWRV